MNLTWVRAFLAAGLSPWEKRAAFVGRREPAEGKQWYEHLGLWRRLDVSTWLDRSSWIEAVRSWKPAALVGYVMTLRVFAESVREAGATDIRPRLVFATGGMLDDETRRILRDVLGAEVVDVFASVEGGCLAWECRDCGGYHLSEDTVIVEVLKDGRPARPGESGEAVITNLHSWAMPLIRFQTGDDVAPAEAAPSCGLRLPLLSGVQGRVNDCIVFKTGERISSQPFYFAVQDVPGVKRWRITQESIDRLLVEIEPGAGFDEAAERAIVGSLEQLVRGTMAVTLSRVASFPFNPDRKFRQIRSKLAGRA
jgi:phenylacetate-CoA ligase